MSASFPSLPPSWPIPIDLYVDARGLSHHVVQWGTGERVMVLLHGWKDLARLFDKVVARMIAPGWRFYAIDFRGHGDSGHAAASGQYHFADYVADVHALIGKLVPEKRVAIFGHSLGGMVGLQLAGAFPEIVSHLAVIESLGPPSMDRPAELSMAVTRLRSYVEDSQKLKDQPLKRYRSVEDAAEKVMARNPRIAREDAIHYATHGTRSDGAGDGNGVVWKFDPRLQVRGPLAWMEELAQPFWERIEAPVLYIEGSHGFTLDEETKARRLGWVKRVERLAIEGAGHHVHLEKPDEVAARLRPFFGLGRESGSEAGS